MTAIDGQTVDAFSDFLLHDIGAGDGIVQGEARGNEMRTAPLWGVSESAPYLHDGSAATIGDAAGVPRFDLSQERGGVSPSKRRACRRFVQTGRALR